MPSTHHLSFSIANSLTDCRTIGIPMSLPWKSPKWSWVETHVPILVAKYTKVYLLLSYKNVSFFNLQRAMIFELYTPYILLLFFGSSKWKFFNLFTITAWLLHKNDFMLHSYCQITRGFWFSNDHGSLLCNSKWLHRQTSNLTITWIYALLFEAGLIPSMMFSILFITKDFSASTKNVHHFAFLRKTTTHRWTPSWFPLDGTTRRHGLHWFRVIYLLFFLKLLFHITDW